MREADRIGEFLERFKKCWEIVPDWRFGQLICNVFGKMQSEGRDPFFPEEHEMIRYFEDYFEEYFGIPKDD